MLPWSCTLRTAQGSYKPFRTNRRSRSLIYGAFETIFSGLVSLSSRSYFLGRWMARRYLIITHYWSITKHNSLTVLRSVWEREKKRLFSLLALAWWARQLACWGEWTHIFAARCVQSMKVEGNSISFWAGVYDTVAEGAGTSLFVRHDSCADTRRGATLLICLRYRLFLFLSLSPSSPSFFPSYLT